MLDLLGASALIGTHDAERNDTAIARLYVGAHVVVGIQRELTIIRKALTTK